jgi:hypothetical protein
MRLNGNKETWIAVSVAAVGFGVDADHVGDVGSLDVGAVEHLLPEVVELVGENAPLDSKGLIVLLPDDAVGHLGEPPDACIDSCLPFLCHWLRTEKIERLIST